MAFYVYILASKRNGTLYIGSTDNLIKRICEYRDGARPGFTKDHAVKTLVWYEAFGTRDCAFRRERQMKEWQRLWKLRLIERTNPGWRDLFDDLLKRDLGPGLRRDERILGGLSRTPFPAWREGLAFLNCLGDRP